MQAATLCNSIAGTASPTPVQIVANQLLIKPSFASDGVGLPPFSGTMKAFSSCGLNRGQTSQPPPKLLMLLPDPLFPVRSLLKANSPLLCSPRSWTVPVLDLVPGLCRCRWLSAAPMAPHLLLSDPRMPAVEKSCPRNRSRHAAAALLLLLLPMKMLQHQQELITPPVVGDAAAATAAVAPCSSSSFSCCCCRLCNQPAMPQHNSDPPKPRPLPIFTTPNIPAAASRCTACPQASPVQPIVATPLRELTASSATLQTMHHPPLPSPS